MTAALILGAAIWPSGPSPTLRRRCAGALALWRAGRVRHLVPAGGQGLHGGPEALEMAELLKAEGVPPERIIPEQHSANTLENIRFSLPILAALGSPDVLIVTDAFHAPRALMVARHFGLAARAAPVSPRGGRLAAQVRLALREAAALPVYALRLQKEPR